LQQLGIPFRGYDRHTGPGGLWDIDNPHSTLYESAHLISSRRMTEFAAFPMPPGPAYPNHRELRQYFRDYAAHFALDAQYAYGTRVEQIAPAEGGRWAVTTVSEPGRDDFAPADLPRTTTLHDGVLIASGMLHHPHWPLLPGRFAGRVMHSSEYRSAEVFAGQRVLVVGCGNSGADIAVDAVHRAARVDLSVRRGYYFLPKFIMGRPTDTLGGAVRLPRALKQRLDALLVRVVMGRPSDYGLPDPDYRMYEAHPVINSLVLHHLGQGDITPRGALRAIEGRTVTFADGARADEVARGIKRTAHEIAEQRRRGAVVEIGVGGAPGLFDLAHAANVGITGELAVARAEEFAVIDVDHRDQTGLAAVEKFAAAHGRTPVLGAAAGGETAAQGHIVAVVVAPQNRVNHAGGGIGAVDRRSAVTQHFDALDRGGGKLVHVDRERGHTALGLANRVRREPAAVDEHERVARADAAEVERGVVTAGVGPEDVGLGEREDAPVRQELEQLGRRGRGANVEVVEIEHGNRQRGLLVDAADV
jgi:cation diffusion facilitator CzcD-associated flavoprotein CzcO